MLLSGEEKTGNRVESSLDGIIGQATHQKHNQSYMSYAVPQNQNLGCESQNSMFSTQNSHGNQKINQTMDNRKAPGVLTQSSNNGG
jgi:hypothetical protein